MVLLELYKGESKWKRYTRVKESIAGITPKILAMRLRELEKEKLVKRKVSTKNFPIKSEYSLTESGEDFIKVIRGMKRWGLKWQISNEHCETVKCKECEF